jgi:mandelamide amidase
MAIADALNALIAHAEDAASSADGPLAALTFAVKANVEVAGLPATAATAGLMDWRAERDAPIVARLRAAGAALRGIANMHELAFGTTSVPSAHGAVRHPRHADRVAGGSSGGSAAAVTAGLVDFSIGTDTGGSCRIPAAVCGCVGFRPSQGRYPSEGLIALSPTRDTAGVLARSVACVRAVDLVSAADAQDVAQVEAGALRLGVPLGAFYDAVAPDVRPVIDAALERVAQRGVQMVPVDLTEASAANAACATPIVLYESVRELAVFLARRPAIGLDVRELVARMSSGPERAALENELGPGAVTGEAYRVALVRERPRLQRALHAAFAEQRLDALVVPTVRIVAPRVDEIDERTFETMIANTDASSNAGLPSLSVPAGDTADGLPVGLELVGPFGADRRLLRIGETVERALTT